MANKPPLLSVRNLTTEYVLDEGTITAVDDVSFDVAAGQVVGIVGESGCGKSATIKSVLRIIQKPGQISAGSIVYHKSGAEPVDLLKLKQRGRALRDIRGAEIALIPQEPMAAFSPVHTIGNQIIEAIRLHQDVSKKDARTVAIESLREVGMPNPAAALDRYSWELSGGLRQRAMIGMALSCRPALLIADEPTTAIDVTTQAQVLSLLRNLQQQHNSSIIFITHDLGVIAQIADHVIVMYLGKVMESAPIDDIFHRPQHPYTKALLQSIPTVRTVNRSKLPTIEGAIPHPFHRPAGCPFFNRCREAIAGTCDRDQPGPVALNDTHSVSCFNVNVNVNVDVNIDVDPDRQQRVAREPSA